MTEPLEMGTGIGKKPSDFRRKSNRRLRMQDQKTAEKVRPQSHSLRHIQILNPTKGPDWGLFSFCFKGCWQHHPPFGDWALDAEWVSEWLASLFERPSTATGRRKTSSHFQWVAAFMGSSLSRDNPVAETDTKARGGQRDGSAASDPEVRQKRLKRAGTLPEVSDDKRTSRP